jgi:ubiquinone/menaquinone biosynthesis C-methylase UbiE
VIDRDVYSSGRYVEHFRPEDGRNPFRALYAAKRADLIAGIRGHLAPGGTVLDVGGGPGRMAVPLAFDYRVTLCDISPEMLSIAQSAASEASIPPGHLAVRQLDAGGPLPFSPAGFDGALCIDLLVHLSDPVSLLKELRRVLTPRGELMVDMSNRSPWWILRYPRALGRAPGRWPGTWRAGGVPPEWQGSVRHYSYGEYRAMLAAARFEVVQEWRYGPTWCPVWFLSRCRPMPD